MSSILFMTCSVCYIGLLSEITTPPESPLRGSTSAFVGDATEAGEPRMGDCCVRARERSRGDLNEHIHQESGRWAGKSLGLAGGHRAVRETCR